MTMPVDRERERRSLKDLANMASMTPPPPSVSAPNSQSGVQRAGEAKGEDSGLIDLAAMTAAAEPAPVSAPVPSAPMAAPASTPLATAGLFDDEPQSVRPGPISQAAQPVPTIPPMPAVPASIAPAPASAAAPVVAAPAMAAPSAPEQEKSKGGKLVAVVFGVVALAAAAAGTFVVMKGHEAKQAAATAMNEAPKAPVAAAPAKAPEPTPAATEAPAAAPSEPSTDLAALPTADTKTAAKGAPRVAAKPAAAAAAPAAAPKAEEPKVASKDMPPPATGPVGALGDEMRKAVGEKEAVPAAGPAGPSGPAAGTVPTKPSQGAVTGALGAVLPAARACLGPDDPISRASVIFGSGGTVQSVNVTGGAAGKPAEACIKAALMKAKVAPFAEATYSAPVTIRH